MRSPMRFTPPFFFFVASALQDAACFGAALALHAVAGKSLGNACFVGLGFGLALGIPPQGLCLSSVSCLSRIVYLICSSFVNLRSCFFATASSFCPSLLAAALPLLLAAAELAGQVTFS